METNLILAGVGGQGILSIAQAISRAALARGWSVKQSEVHGMSQRGGAVESHLRFADHVLHSDLVPRGKADIILSVEPLESLRYVSYLSAGGRIVSSSVPFVNIPNYPPIESVLERVSQIGPHVLIDAERLARAAGSARASNMVMLGAASMFLEFDAADLEAAIEELFTDKGARAVEINRRALRFGRHAAQAYEASLRGGMKASEVRHWIESAPIEVLVRDDADGAAPAGAALPMTAAELSPAELHAMSQALAAVRASGREQLYEHEVYGLMELVGAIAPPRHLFVPRGGEVTPELLAPYLDDQVVLKLVSPDVVHKSEARAVAFVRREADVVNRRIEQMSREHLAAGSRVDGVLVVEFVEHGKSGFGNELFVGIRATREFGPVIAAGLGGVDTEYLAERMRPGLAVAKAPAMDTTPEEFFELFRRTAAYDLLSGAARGHARVVADGELLRCFRAFLAIARRFCAADVASAGSASPPGGAADERPARLIELEVNPFAFAHQRLVPLDGRARLGDPVAAPPPRPLERIKCLTEPRSIAVMGVSSKRANFGRIILNNILECGFPTDRLYVVKEGDASIDGVRCVPDLASLPEPIDLLVLATAARETPSLVQEVIDHGRIRSVILISGGMGEKEGTQELQSQVREAILSVRARTGSGDGGRDADAGPVFLGGNCLGALSRPGKYDTFFVPRTKLDPRWEQPGRRIALVSQSGAFIITRMSNLELLDPTIAVSVGNQVDLTVSDLLRHVGRRDDIDCVGVYVEGFQDVDGLEFVRAVREVSAAGKIVIFYKAGRTAAGRSATAGHTASVAGDYDVCQAAVAHAGAIVTDTFKEFEQLLELAGTLHDKRVGGRRIGVLSNAGYETVGMADTVIGARYVVEMAELAPATRGKLADALARLGLDSLVDARNPLDLTPMAGDQAYEDTARVMLEADEVDAVVVATVPLTAQMLTTPVEITHPTSIAHRLPKLFRASTKPLIVVIDAGPPFEELVRSLRSSGIPVFRTADQAIRSLGRYLCHRAALRPETAATTVSSSPIGGRGRLQETSA